MNPAKKLEWQRTHSDRHNKSNKVWREKNPDYNKNYFNTIVKATPDRYQEAMTKFKSTFEKYKQQWNNIKKDIGYDTCSICGYNKCQAAIEYHHPDPDTKEYPPWLIFHHKPTIRWIEALKSLVPLCSNCHRELHHLKKREE